MGIDSQIRAHLRTEVETAVTSFSFVCHKLACDPSISRQLPDPSLELHAPHISLSDSSVRRLSRRSRGCETSRYNRPGRHSSRRCREGVSKRHAFRRKPLHVARPYRSVPVHERVEVPVIVCEKPHDIRLRSRSVRMSVSRANQECPSRKIHEFTFHFTSRLRPVRWKRPRNGLAVTMPELPVTPQLTTGHPIVCAPVCAPITATDRFVEPRPSTAHRARIDRS
jgi:hypothetical protein